MNWDELSYWDSGEWQAVQEKLDDLDKAKIHYAPKRRDLFRILKLLPMEDVKVVIIGQDPYPSLTNATGLAFSIPPGVKDYPGSLVNILDEYNSDLHYPAPSSGDLTPWVKQGVLLWNAYPSCEVGKPGSHHWTEWTYLTQEIIEKLDKDGMVVFILLGKVAQMFEKFITLSDVIKTSHPSPMGVNHGFRGSRIFTTANAKLVEAGVEPVDWRLNVL